MVGGEQPISNTYENGKGIMVFANDVTDLSEAFDFDGRKGDETQLTSVIIPNSVTRIGDYAFAYCSGLTSIEIPNSVISIGDGAFYTCENLTSINIPNSVTSIGNEAFYNCTGLTSITYNGTTYTNASQLISALTSNGVTLGDGVFDHTSLSA